MNPYLTEENKPSDFLLFTLDYYGISLERFKAMSDEQVRVMVKRFSDVLNDGTVQKSTGHFNSKVDMEGHTLYEGGFKNFSQEDRTLNDSGSFSRYFDLDKWFEKTIADLPESVRKTFPFLICPKASKSERNQGCESLPIGKVEALHGNVDGTLNKRSDGKPSTAKNIHPTVKPLKLMSYLVTLGSRPLDVVLDPFVGSGTTCLAAEILNRKWIGIDNNPEYCEIGRKRLATVPEKLETFMKISEQTETSP